MARSEKLDLLIAKYEARAELDEFKEQQKTIAISNLQSIKNIVKAGKLDNSLISFLKSGNDFESLLNIKLSKVTAENKEQLSKKILNAMNKIEGLNKSTQVGSTEDIVGAVLGTILVGGMIFTASILFLNLWRKLRYKGLRVLGYHEDCLEMLIDFERILARADKVSPTVVEDCRIDVYDAPKLLTYKSANLLVKGLISLRPYLVKIAYGEELNIKEISTLLKNELAFNINPKTLELIQDSRNIQVSRPGTTFAVSGWNKTSLRSFVNDIKNLCSDTTHLSALSKMFEAKKKQSKDGYVAEEQKALIRFVLKVVDSYYDLSTKLFYTSEVLMSEVSDAVSDGIRANKEEDAPDPTVIIIQQSFSKQLAEFKKQLTKK